MKISRFSAILILATSITAQTRDMRIQRVDPTVQKAFQKSVKVALLVGINTYPDGSGVTPLRFAVQDVAAIAEVLEDQGYLVRKLTDSSATRAMIRSNIKDLTAALDPADGTFLFYFGGHGFSQSEANFLVPFGATVDDLIAEGLPVSDVEKLLKSSGAKRTMMFIDACRNDPGAGARSGGQRTFTKLQAAEGLKVMYATREGRVSFEDPTLQHGIFTTS